MTFPFECPACGSANPVEWSEVGRRIYCRGCGQPMVVAPPMELAGPATPAPSIVKFRCPACQRKFATRADLAGKKIRCNRCGGGVRVPASDGAVAAAATSSGPTGVLELPPSLFEELEPLHEDEAALPSRAEAMEEVRRQEEEAAAARREKAAKKRKKRKKPSGYFDLKETLQLVGGVGALVVVLTLVAWGYPHFRFPLGGILCVIGFITYLLGLAALRSHVREEGEFKALLFRFFPPYQWWYVATRWQETRDYVAFFAAGMVILSLGGAIIKTSPVGVRAAAADRAFQKSRRDEAARPPAIPGPPATPLPAASPDDED